MKEFQASTLIFLQSLVSTQWRAAVCLTDSSTWLGGPRQLRMTFIHNEHAPSSGLEEEYMNSPLKVGRKP